MKATQRDFSSKVQASARECRVFFFCGQDEAGAAEAAEKVCSQLPEAGERVELPGGELRRDPVRLADEARSTSLFGDVRHIYVRAAGDEAHDAVKNLLAVVDAGEGEACPVLIVASSATDKSRTAKLLEKRGDALVAIFYPPDLRDVAREVRAKADAAGVRLGGDLAERIARGAGLDLRLAGSELAKLALYLDADPLEPKDASVEALEDIGARTEDDGFMPLVNAALSGETAKLQGELARLHEVAMNPVGLLLALERRAAQLAALAAKLGPRGSVGDLLEEETRARRVFWRDRRDLETQLRNWRGARLDRLVRKLVELHRALLANSQSAELLLAQGLAEISRFAAPRR